MVKNSNSSTQTKEQNIYALPLRPNVAVAVVVISAPFFFIGAVRKKKKSKINGFGWLYVKSVVSKSYSVHPPLL